MQTLRLLKMVACLSVLGLLTVSCGQGVVPVTPKEAPSSTEQAALSPRPSVTLAASPSALTPTPKPLSDQPQYGGILYRANYDDPVSLDIHQETLPASHLVLANFYSGLARFDSVELSKVVPDLAETWEPNTDGTVWTFHLRKDVRWHDGKPFTAEDAKFSLERMAFWKEHNIVSPRSGPLLTAVKEVEAPDENTVRVKLKYPTASFLTNIAAGWVLILPKHVIQAKGDMKKDVIGTGPFRLKSHAPLASFEMVKNPEYFIKGRPYLDGITFYPVKDDATRLAAFRTGRVRMTTTGMYGLNHQQAQLVRKEMADTAVVHTHTSYLRTLFLFKLTKAPWNDVRIRKAIDLVFDRQAAIKVNSNVGFLGAAMDPTGAWGIPEEEMRQKPGYRQPKDADIAEAKRLMAEAGFTQGFKSTMLVRIGGTQQQVAVVAKDQLAKIGIELELELRETAVITALYTRHAFEISFTGFTEPLDDPDVFSAYYVTEGARNYGDFSDKQVDELFEKQARTLDSVERKRMVREIQQRLLELAPYPVMYWDPYNMGHWKEVRGYTPGGGAFSHSSLVDVWLAR